MKRQIIFILNILLIFLISACGASSPPEAKFLIPNHYSKFEWYPLTQNTISKALMNDKLMLLYIYKDECESCTNFKKTTLTSPCLYELMDEEYLFVAINAKKIPSILLKVSDFDKKEITMPLTAFYNPRKGIIPFRLYGSVSSENYCEVLKLVRKNY
jgi:thioredoxin-related protein